MEGTEECMIECMDNLFADWDERYDSNSIEMTYAAAIYEDILQYAKRSEATTLYDILTDTEDDLEVEMTVSNYSE